MGFNEPKITKGPKELEVALMAGKELQDKTNASRVVA
jgi:hypothetical protein